MAGTIATQPGQETQISKKENGKLILDQEALEAVICNPSIGERPISIVAIVGAFRKGKSFLLNFFLRYLRNKGYENENWMGKPEDTIDEGFAWRGGMEGVTSGITIWSEPFIINRQGEEIAILLMDTQGAFESSSEISECIQFFTTSLIMSSLVIFNVQSQIQEDNLHYLEYFTTYLQSVKEKSNESASETLMFLVRDWVHGEELGLTGGEKYLNRIASKKESRMSRIKETFDNDLHCYLLPLPGENVMKSREGTVQIKEINAQFLEYVGKLSGDIFHSSSELLKTNKNSGRSLVNIIINSWNIFQELPEPSTINELASKNHAMKCQIDAETEYEAFLKKLAAEKTLMREFERLSIEEQVVALKTYRDKVSRCLKSDVEAGVETLQAKMKQKHNEYLQRAQMASKNHATACQIDAETEYEAFLKKLAEEKTSMREFGRLSIEEQVVALKAYRDKVSCCFESDVEAGVETLQRKLQQKHNIYLVMVQLVQKRKNDENLISRREFESYYMDECEKILCGDDSAEGKLISLNIVHKYNKDHVKEEFSALSKDEREKIENDVEICFGVYKNRIALKKRSKSAQKCREKLTDITRYLGESTEEFEDFIEELRLDAEFKKELKTEAKTCVKTGDDICSDPIIAKIDMTILEGSVMDWMHGMLQEFKKVYATTYDMEKGFDDIKNRFLESYSKQIDKSNQEDNVAPNFFIERHLEPEFDFARKINAKNMEYLESDLQNFVLEARLIYMEHMHNLCNSAYVTTEILEKENENMQKALFEKLDQLWDELSDATDSLQDYRIILKHELSGIFQELKEVNKKNETFFHGVVDSFGEQAGVTADYKEVMGKDHGVVDKYVGAAIIGTIMTFSVRRLHKETASMLYRSAKSKYHKKLKQHIANKISYVKQEMEEAASKQN